MENQNDRLLHAVPDTDQEATIEESNLQNGGDSEEAVVLEDWWISSLPSGIRENVSREGWRVTSPDAAQWVEERYYETFTRKRVNDLQADHAVKLLEDEIARIKRRNEERNEPFVKALNWWGSHLLDYTLQLRQQDESVKSWKGLYLEVGTRASQAKFEVLDEALFEKWLVDNKKTDWYETSIKPKKAVIKKEIQYQDDKVIDSATGTIIDGLVAEPAKIVAKIDIEEEVDADGKPLLHPIRQLYVFGEDK